MMHRRPFRRFPLVRARLLVAALLFALFALPFSGHRAEAAVPAAVLADLRSKAESGDSIAQYNLGVAYADAADPVSDASEAYAWLTLAGEQGANLEVLQTLIERLSPSQLAEGKRLLDSRRSELAQRAREASPFVGTAVNAAATGASAVVAAATDVVATPANPAPSGSGAAAKEAALGKIAELNQQISARDQRIAALEAELSDAKSKTGSRELQEQLAAKAQLLAASDAARETLSQQYATLSAEADTLRAKFASEQKWGAELVRSEQARKELEAERDLLQRQLSAGTNADAQASADLVRRAEEAEANLATALRSYAVQSTELDQLRTTLASAEGESTALTGRLADLEAAKVSLGNELVDRSAAAAEADRLRDQLRQTQQQAAASALELNQLRIRLAILAPSPSSTLSSPTRPGAGDTTSLAAPAPEALPAAGSSSSASTTSASARSHVVQPGDTLSRIAQRYYGNGRRWNEILAANKAVIPNPDRLAIGTTLVIP
jgi:nucleoid-associated protein YgaU